MHCCRALGLVMGICLLAFKLFARENIFLLETGFSLLHYIDTTLMVEILPNRKRVDFDYLKLRQMR